MGKCDWIYLAEDVVVLCEQGNEPELLDCLRTCLIVAGLCLYNPRHVGTLERLINWSTGQVNNMVPLVCLFFGATAPHWVRASSFTRFLDHTQRRTTVGRTPL